MGEVYRAEDLRLSQVVAIKFLPESLSQDPSALERFHSEVRMARQVSHPNVCRMFDIGEVDGVSFLTMEYIDGEDLSSLVRRIGRLPQDKAIEITRQMCAGLAAAHDRGVVHRDLKPANVMLDGAGKARITDFGLAAIAAHLQGAEIRAGTPAYMAPEQLFGKEVTSKSDIYSLGLVLYELLTGKRPFEAPTLAELRRLREQGTITNPSTLVKDLDPLVERVILRCLEADPAKRPASALQVAAALPGGDPLAAALAAGETPSPEMVAAAGEREGIRPAVALGCFVAALVLIAIGAVLATRESGLRQMSLQNSPDALIVKSREILAKLGYSAAPRDTASGFTYDEDYLDYLMDEERPGPRWTQVLQARAPLALFWFRESPKRLLPRRFASVSLTPGVVDLDDPPQVNSGEASVELDASGRLQYLLAIPPEKVENPSPPQAIDWQPLFAAAELNMSAFQPTEPVWNPLAASDARAAWDGKWPDSDRPLHIEAAAFQGKPVYFQLMGNWTKPHRMVQPAKAGSKASDIFGLCFLTLLIGGGIWLALRNTHRGKGDRKGAWRIAQCVFVLEMAIFLVSAHLSISIDTLYLLMLATGMALFLSLLLWTLYLALEPYVRSKWPQTIVSWTRMVSGRLRDPVVGRDVLYGVLLGAIWVAVFFAGYALNVRSGERPLLPPLSVLSGMKEAFTFLLGNAVGGIMGTLIFFVLVVFLRVLVRNRWVAGLIFMALFAVPKLLESHHPAVDIPVWIIIYSIAAFAVVRFGLVVLGAATFTANVLLNLPYTADFSLWYAPAATALVLSVVALAAFGFYTALAGQKIIREELLD